MSELLDEHGVPADRLTLEITEDGCSAAAGRCPPCAPATTSASGCPSTTSAPATPRCRYLRRLPVHEVKIDRSFVQGMATDPSDLAIVRAVVDLARHFGLRVVAEGVESELTLGLLEDMRCDIGPGLPVQPSAALRALRGLARRPDRADDADQRRCARSAGGGPTVRAVTAGTVVTGCRRTGKSFSCQARPVYA